MKIIISFIIVILLLYAGVMSYFYIETIAKNRELTLSRDVTDNLKRKLQEEIKEIDSVQQALQKENEELKKESLSYLRQQKDTDEKRQEIENIVGKQDQRLKSLKGKLQAAEKELQTLKQENLKLADIHDFTGNIQVKKQEEKISQLEADLSTAREQMKKQEALLHYNLGVTYTKEKNYEMAIDEYEKALSLNLKEPDTHYNLAILYDELGKNPKRAIEHYQKYLELRPDAPDIDEVKEWITNLMLGEVKPKEAEFQQSAGVATLPGEKKKGIFLKKIEEIPQRDKTVK